jgi:hypothetical protein
MVIVIGFPGASFCSADHAKGAIGQ